MSVGPKIPTLSKGPARGKIDESNGELTWFDESTKTNREYA